MIDHWSFEPHPWLLRENGLDLERLAQTESVFALSNGHIGVRANLDEGEPHGLPGTYLNGFYELRPLPYAEAGYGYPEAGQTVVNVTNGKLMRLLVDDEPFDVRYGELLSHRRELDLRAGLLHRRAEWRSPGHRSVAVTSTRLVSLVQRAVMAVHYEVEPLDAPVRLVVQSELVANEALPEREQDPRAAAALERPLVALEQSAEGARALLVHQTAASKLRVAAMMDHTWQAPEGTEIECQARADSARVTFIARLEPGERLGIVKLVSYGWSSTRSVPALRDQVAAALAAARHAGWNGLVEEQRQFLEGFWQSADVEVDGDSEIQLAVRFAMFHILQAGARAEGRAVPAKGLTGPGYDGHAFWDTESMVLPVLTYTLPRAAADALAWRHSTLPQAERRARQLGLSGAAFPWRTIAGEECSAYWPAGTAAFHIGADIAAAVARYVSATGDDTFERDVGVDLLVATARLWMALGCFDRQGQFRIDGVTGPDEYSAVADNNIYTNLMAARNLEEAARVVERHPGRSDTTEAEVRSWRRAASAMTVPYDKKLRVHPQAEGFTEHARWDFEATRPEQYPLLLHFPYFDLYRKQVVKQADLVAALFYCGDRFSDEEKASDFEYYEAITVRDSSLSACIQGVIAAETGHLGLAYDYWAEASLMDLDDLQHNTRDGLHIAALAGAYIMAVAGFGGMRDHAGQLSFRPRLPAGLERLAFRVQWRGGLLKVEVRRREACYEWSGPGELRLAHYGTEVVLSPAEPLRRPLPRAPRRRRPSQPKGREPARRR